MCFASYHLFLDAIDVSLYVIIFSHAKNECWNVCVIRYPQRFADECECE
jgi:hypothetical protein